MNKKLVFGVILVFILGFSFFVFGKDKKIKNYPSSGKDVVAFGDSLVEGVGSTGGGDFISLLSKRIGRNIVNLGVSGNTTRDGLDRLDQLDSYKPKVVILLLGGNDYLRRIPEEETFQNLEKIIKNIQDRGSVVLLLGIRGGLITDKFENNFDDLSNKMQTAYVSNVLSGLITNNEYMSDSVHPNNLGYKKIADRVYPELSKLLK